MKIDEKLLKDKLENIYCENKIAGMAVAVTDRNETVFASGFGVESVERPVLKVSTDSLFKIASISKMITGIVIMRLVEAGLLELDVPVKKYVPWLKLSRPEAENTMTLRHLLSHTSRLSGEIRSNGPKDERYLEQRLQEILPELAMESLPGDGVFLYSNYGFVLASYAAQKVTGKYYSDLATELVLQPLGMNCSFYHLNALCTYPLALPHVQDSEGNLRVKHIITSDATRFGSGELFSNVNDLCKLMRFFINHGITDSGERILSESSVKAMLCRQVKRDETDYHGFSVHIRRHKEMYLYGHTGFLRPYAASLFWDPESGYGVVTLMNTVKDGVREKILEMIL